MPHKNLEALRAYKAAWHIKNRARLLKKAKQYRDANAEAISEGKKKIYHDRYKIDPAYKLKIKLYGKKRRLENRDHVKAIEKRSYERHKDRILAYNRSIARTPKRLARSMVRNRIRDGKIQKASSFKCIRCRKQASEYHHHKGYARKYWLDVVAVCAQCHKDIHAVLTFG